MNRVKVSVIIPMFNSRKTIIPCIESVLNQDYNDYEILILDDGSSDDSYKIVEKYIYENNLAYKIKLIKQENKGPSSARNKLIEISSGEYIAFLDSDDIWRTNKLSKQIEILEQDRDIILIATNINGKKNKKFSYIEDISFEKLLFKNYFATSTVVARKNIVQNLGGFNEKKKYSEDYELWLRIAKYHKCILLNQNFVLYGGGKVGFGHSGLSSRLKEMEIGELQNYKFLYKNKYISTFLYIMVVIWSYIKYIKRKIIANIRNINI